MSKPTFSITAFFRGFSYAGRGLWIALKTQRNMQVHTLCTGLVIGFGIWLGVSAVEWALLLLTCGVVIACEMLNTALEMTLDLISREQHPEIGLAKDVAAGSVLVASLFAIGVAVCLLLPKLLAQRIDHI